MQGSSQDDDAGSKISAEGDRAAAIIAAGDLEGIFRMALEARDAWNRGVECRCSNPILTGWDTMCSRCLLVNRGQRKGREAAMLAPHAFVRRSTGVTTLCQFCSAWLSDPRHGEVKM